MTDQIVKRAAKRIQNGERFGQALWNQAWEDYPELRGNMELISGTIHDPFYDNGNARRFLEWLSTRLQSTS